MKNDFFKLNTSFKNNLKAFGLMILTVLIPFSSQFGTAVIPDSMIKSFDTEKANFSVRYKNEVTNWKVAPLFVLPGETVLIDIPHANSDQFFSFQADFGQVDYHSPSLWSWTAPKQSGIATIVIGKTDSTEKIQINAFILVPAKKIKNGLLNGYKIGSYPIVSKDKKNLYPYPDGFVEVTPENKNTLVSPHFSIGEFICKQAGRYPKYVALKEKLIFKLEYILETVNLEGIPCEKLTVMSGFRTPHYNRSLRNAKLSRHMFGDAADVYIDNNRDGNMDDLNHDGQVNQKDAEILSQIVLALNQDPSFKPLQGGIGHYRATHSHGPFVHVDTRGVLKEWSN
ncbi:MAG: D-Ala-D-Ala carboxypeptidase family metallohydrolase [Elusimicrobiota bacterium]